MFSSVSSLNKRIEELEDHKKHLLAKVKEAGDTTGLDYIVKTQGLDGIQKQEGKIQVENYDPKTKAG